MDVPRVPEGVQLIRPCLEPELFCHEANFSRWRYPAKVPARDGVMVAIDISINDTSESSGRTTHLGNGNGTRMLVMGSTAIFQCRAGSA